MTLATFGTLICVLVCFHVSTSTLAYVRPLQDARSRKQPALGPWPLCAHTPSGGSNEAEDAARLYQRLAAEEGRRRTGPPSNGVSSEPGKGFGVEPAARKRGGRATRRSRRSPDSAQEIAEVEGQKMRLKLEALDKELKYEVTRNRKRVFAEKDQKSLQTNINRLKLQLAEAKRDAQEKEERAENADLRVRKLLDSSTFTKPSPVPASVIPISSRQGGSSDIESLRVDGVTQIESLRAENRRKLSNYEKAAAMDRQGLRNRAWSLETELAKQNVVLDTARKEANEAQDLAERLEIRLVELVQESDSRIDDLEGEVVSVAESLTRTRNRAASRLLAMRQILRIRLRRVDEEAEEKLKAVQAEMDAELGRVQRQANEKLLVLKRQSEDAVVRAKREKEDAVAPKESGEAFKTHLEGRLERENIIAERRVETAEEEMARQLEEFHTTAENDKKTLREIERNKVAEVQAKVALETRRLLNEMDRKLGAQASGSVTLEKDLAGSDEALREYEEDRTSLRQLVRLAGGVVARKIRLRRKED
eukprot:CAMPEP_0113549964 /NCGR_PEP_ID=MMETSP0015_2-20120614/13726_1 /TAXON_ID=2838 /ORGANISM="Odontella" /LENGTH=534 /DNA_ID=CAMNT_0000450733 /DNA_START=90 /DNA_END=1695 /DNA_ORIENTATION=- /assembly_acc=CAM_ASM_000160